VDAGDDLTELRERLTGAVRRAVSATVHFDERVGLHGWDVGTVPTVVEGTSGDVVVRGYPALLDEGESVSLRVFTSVETQQRVMRRGVRRLLLLTAAPSRRNVERGLGRDGRLAFAAWGEPFNALIDDCIAAAVDDVLDRRAGDELPWDQDDFRALQDDVRAGAPAIAVDALCAAAEVVAAAAPVRDKLATLVAPSLETSVHDARAHLRRLVGAGFVTASGVDHLADVRRYVQGIGYRVERLASDVGRDLRRIAEVRPLEDRYAALVATFGRRPLPSDVRDIGWALEELRISLFAQPLGLRGSVSGKRVAQMLDRLGA
jgi:ATP-dependent helicase HrpA